MNQALIAALILTVTMPGAAGAADPAGFAPPAPLPDLSGLVWLEGDRLLAVHDAKNPKEIDLPRLSVLRLPASLQGVLWRPLAPAFPEGNSSDLEAVARIPGTSRVLLAESGDDGGPFDRIFLAELRGDAVEIQGMVRWREAAGAYNIEAIAVAPAADGRWLLLWAERNSGKTSTELTWAQLRLDPFRVEGPVASLTFSLPAAASRDADGPLYNRAIVALDLDAEGRLYAAATFDPEEVSPDPHNGPFRSIVYRIGRVGGGRVELDPEPAVIGSLDGVKVESLAIRERDGRREIFVGTDDENYGGVLRALPIADETRR